jgi:hypothetical protein
MKTLHTTQISEAEQKPKPVEDADFDACSEDYISREEKNAYKPLPLKTRRRKKSQRGDNSSRIVKIGANTNMFVVSPEEMPRIDPKVACHRLNVNPIMRYVAQ